MTVRRLHLLIALITIAATGAIRPTPAKAQTWFGPGCYLCQFYGWNCYNHPQLGWICEEAETWCAEHDNEDGFEFCEDDRPDYTYCQTFGDGCPGPVVYFGDNLVAGVPGLNVIGVPCSLDYFIGQPASPAVQGTYKPALGAAEATRLWRPQV